ncbi:MAG: beta-ketoacyl-[acyl-carrier-protein] synthase family protein [Victivallales bacterium]|nr:beta-ketoacyl-[acyl-carrier-protein] synthase family protein [Victivallales bacterium]
MRRVVVSGYGVGSAYGFGAEALRQGLKSGRSAVKRLDGFSAYQGLHSHVGASIDADLELKSIPRIYRRSMGRVAQFAALAALEAREMSGLDDDVIKSPSTACIMGSTMGSAGALNEAFQSIVKDNNLAEISGMQFFKCVSHTVVMNTAQFLGINGCILCPAAACASSLQAIGLGMQLIRSGTIDVAFCGGAEELSALVTGTFDSLMAASCSYNDRPELASRPFDAKRDGLVCGEGAGVLVLESLDSALKRKAKIYCELTGYNTCGNASHISQSDSTSVSRCIHAALADAGVNTSEVDYISAHATATLQGDAAEARALADIFGENIPVSSMKGGLGHTLGASGALETIAVLMMMDEQLIYPTMNLDTVADDCKGLDHVSELREQSIDIFVKNCFAFGGINAVVVGRRYTA